MHPNILNLVTSSFKKKNPKTSTKTKWKPTSTGYPTVKFILSNAINHKKGAEIKATKALSNHGDFMKLII